MLNLIAIGMRLKEIRGSITQKKIAEEFGVQRSYIANMETGRTQPSLEYLLFNSKKFNIPMDWILRGEEVFSNTDQTEDPILRNMIAYLRLIWNGNNQDMQSWLRIQFTRCFPDYQEELLKNGYPFKIVPQKNPRNNPNNYPKT